MTLTLQPPFGSIRGQFPSRNSPQNRKSSGFSFRACFAEMQVHLIIAAGPREVLRHDFHSLSVMPDKN